MLSRKLWWEGSKEHSYFLGVCVSCPCPEVELSKVKHEAINYRLDEWRGVGTMEKSMSLITRSLYGKTQWAISVGIWSVRVGVTKMDVSRDIVGTLCLKTKERELVVGDA